MTNVELAKDYQERGWFAGMTAEQIKNEVIKLEQETASVDKRTYNGKLTRAFNNAKIVIARIILEAQAE